MVIQCPECTTRFKLPDEKIKPEGVKVRCAKCRHIFVVAPEPAPSEPEADEAIATAAQPQPEQPEAEPSAGEETGEDLWGSEFSAAALDSPTTEEQAAGAAVATYPSEEDWGIRFDEPEEEQIEVESTASLPADEEQEWLSAKTSEQAATSDDWSDSFGELDLSGETEATATAEESPETDAPAWETDFDESDLGLSAVDELPAKEGSSTDFLPDDAWEEEASVTTAPAGSVETSDETLPAFEEVTDTEIPAEAFGFDEETGGDDSDAEFEFEEDEQAAETAEAELDEPQPFAADEDTTAFSFDEASGEEFSFDSDDDKPADAFAFDKDDLFAPDSEPPLDEIADRIGFEEPQQETPGRTDFGFDGIAFGEDRREAAPAAEEAQDLIAPVERPKPVEKPAQPKLPAVDESMASIPALPKAKRKSPMSNVLRIFLVLLLGLGAVAGYLLWQGGFANMAQLVEQLSGSREQDAAGPQIRLPLPNSFFIMNREAGQLFVVQGEAVNGYPGNRSAIAVKGMLHDEKGNVLMQQTVFCGNSLDHEDLQNASFAQIEEAMNNQFGNALSNLNVGPGKAIPYMIVFRDLPPNVTEFTVEVADSKPGGQQ